ncbi:MAG: ABC transporter ATP-binding protein [Clostridia bacterium]|nr:ABC transporter ATP-binding protein [Clostridia bacterium]
MKNSKGNQNETKVGDKRGGSRIPDYEQLFQEGAESSREKGGALGIYKLLLAQNKGKIFASTILYLIKHLPVLLIPLITAEVINTVTLGGPDTVKKMVIYGILILLLVLENIPMHVLREKYNNEMLRTIGAGLRGTVVRKLQHLSLTYHKQIESGKIQSKFMRDIEAVETLNRQITNSLVPTIINVVVYVAISVMKSGTVTLFFMAVIPINVLLVYFFRNSMRSTNRVFRKENENISAKVSSMIDMIPVTKAHGLENEEIVDIEEKIRTLKEHGLLVDRVNAYFGSIIWVASQIMSGVCLFFTAWLALKGKIQIGDIVLFQSYFTSISTSIQGIVNVYPEITKGMESVSSVSEIILSKDLEDSNGKIRLRYVHGTVKFEDACYRYPDGEEDIIKNLSLDVEPGECVAFVGASGSGKSTVMNMIIGFLKPTRGNLFIDGKPIDELKLSDYRHFISVVPQNCVMFTGSIRENITYGLKNVSEERLREVVHLANIDEFADKLPYGLDTQVGENGANLSGGQKQRISIARALIRDPKILILDEATSALDNISEYHVQQAINRLTAGRTTFIVAHRLSTIRNADKIVVMEEGRCIEMGTYSELMEKQGKFYELKSLNDIINIGETF